MMPDDLCAYLFDSHDHPLEATIRPWLRSSRRFAAFVDTFRSKIRKKVRTVSTPEGLLDLQFELGAAYRLLQEAAFSIVYEPGAPRSGRSPDFAVTYTTSTTFMVEATRLHPSPSAASPMDRLGDVIASKLGQCLPRYGTVLLVGMAEAIPTEPQLHEGMVALQRRAEQGELAWLNRYGFRDRSEFFQHYHRLSAVLVCPPSGTPTTTWLNAQAKHPLGPRVRAALYRSHGLVP